MGIFAAPTRPQRGAGSRAATGGLIGGLLLVPLLLGSGGAASATPGDPPAGGEVMSSATRSQAAPNVFYPLPAYSQPRDLKLFKPGVNATEIVAGCGVTVRSAIPGRVHLIPNEAMGGTMVTVSTTVGRLTTSYGYLRRVNVTEGQILSGGQAIGAVGDGGKARGCMLRFKVATSGTSGFVNPTDWLERYVSRPAPDSQVFGNTGFVLATINSLGASHTNPGGDAPSYPSWATRTARLVTYVHTKRIDVAGMQEFQKPQHKMFLDRSADYAAFPANQSTDTENAIVWRKKAFTLVESHTVNIPYFNGAIRKMPYVLLKQVSTGRTAWFINVHNPADTRKYHNQGQWRAKAVQVEKDLIVRLRGDNRPVFLTGDMNDREGVFCAITENKLALSADSVPNMTCKPPASMWIDWVFAAGQTRFSWYFRDWSFRDAKIADHPAVLTRAFLSE